MRVLALASSLALALLGCTSSSSSPPEADQSMYLTGSEEAAVTHPDGTVTCTNPKKVLICHIPPGNPANAHDICVGEPAVVAHEARHGDSVGACDAPPDDGSGSGTVGVIP